MLRKCFALIGCILSLNVNAVIVTSVFGDVQEHNPLVLELINSKAMQRLKHIDQSGPEAYITPNFISFSRYEHSIGVYALLKRYNVSTQEQIAGLMHDTSHTVFSHLGDIIFQEGDQRNESYQDNIHNWFLTNMGVDQILLPYNLTLAEISPKNIKFTALEQPYPDMNADRIEYNLHTAVVLNDLSSKDVNKILEDLQYQNGKWYFNDLTSAKKFAKLSTYYTKVLWGDPHNTAMYVVTSAAIKYALFKKIITKQEINFGVDQQIIEKLRASEEKNIKQLVKIMYNIDAHYVLGKVNNYDVFHPIKMRGIDPLVQDGKKLKRLSDISIDFKKELLLTSQIAQQGVYLKFVNIKDAAILELLKNGSI